MFRRGVSILVMLGYLAGQSAAVPHAHASGSQRDHDACEPHIHLAWFGEHHHHHHREHYGRDNAVAALGNDYLAVGFDRGATEDHDDDAIYVPSGLTAGATNMAYPTGFPELQAPKALLSCDEVVGLILNITTFGVHLRPPDSIGQGCALFLRLLTLRI
jgi:hypothetical protein